MACAMHAALFENVGFMARLWDALPLRKFRAGIRDMANSFGQTDAACVRIRACRFYYTTILQPGSAYHLPVTQP